ncbi:SPOR domain-containing protein [Desulfonatronovibrio hydrogenovorans]|uniref:SPOR domain-containing protein n=1 Tax=Desulfonatronovibrio hydrogenovorans TaxID=53245 RepID=UPI00048B93D0|nr:SPOR domain-containing protein [Desulfonatronovibrio hydrogenovorans]
MAARNQKKKGPKASPGFKLELNFTRALSLGAFIILAVVWSFILGVFIGRGYDPEDVIPDISRIIPDSTEERSVPRVLRPEELEFFDKLRSTPSQPAPAAPAPPAPQARIDPQPRIEPRPDPAPAPETVPREKFVYTYQVGSFQTMERAGRLQQMLMDDGITASITKAFAGDEPWFRVIVEFETSAEEAPAMMEQLKKHGINQPLFRGKRPS